MLGVSRPERNEGPVSVTTTYTVNGMTCGHCASSVTEELSGVDGVTGVDVQLATGAVTVTSSRELTRDEVSAAVSEAGYELVG
ncbi:heavy-metal-associated domain-containing protein [Actinosynnema sp. NPDC050436]|uniref:heavy-metal-associated domain-containing protein n=1 Tax=Actinosynnema sp. NPDC050436 TaxID=3155659 RepID=UPI0033F9BFD6